MNRIFIKWSDQLNNWQFPKPFKFLKPEGWDDGITTSEMHKTQYSERLGL